MAVDDLQPQQKYLRNLKHASCIASTRTRGQNALSDKKKIARIIKDGKKLDKNSEKIKANTGKVENGQFFYIALAEGQDWPWFYV